MPAVARSGQHEESTIECHLHGCEASANFSEIRPISSIPRFVKFQTRSNLCILLLATGILPAGADWRDEIGFTRLKLLAEADLPTAPSQGLSQIEAPDGNRNFEPNRASNLFSFNTFFSKSGTSGVSDHATHVATNFYGSSSVLTGACGIDLYNANLWLAAGFLQRETTNFPAGESRHVQNHSWVGPLSANFTASQAEEIGRRLDYAIDHDDFVSVVGVNNGSSNPLPAILCQTYNTISVGRDDGAHSAGPTTLDGMGRTKPDIVAPSTAPEDATSWTTPMVAGSAGLLYAKLQTGYSLTGTDLARVVKALLLASATKNTVPGWNNSASSPLDETYGAGELNLYHAYSTLRTGRVAASGSVRHPLRGWAAESVSANATKIYYFNIPVGAPSSPFSAALTWHRNVASAVSGQGWNKIRTWSSSLDNLSLKLHHASGFTLGDEIAASDSGVDNVELIHQAALPPGNYALKVTNPSTVTNPAPPPTPYALAWHSLPAVTIVATVSTAKEIDGQPGTLTLTRTGDTTLPLLVPLAISGSAISGIDFQPVPASITLAVGEASKTVEITPIDDFLAQGDRTVIVAVAADFALVRDPAQTATVTIQDKPFDGWRFANFTPPELTNPTVSSETADPDGDQLANLLEYALGLAPKTPSASPVAMTDLSGYLALSVAKNSAATDITWGAEVTGELSSWLPAVPTTNTVTDFAARDSVLKNAATQRFIRLKITRP